jgi:anaerobic dimethyl sulfoxide reductase subunit B (iron-sulfur subunit)
MSKQLAFSVDLSKCTGCKACQVACKDKNNLPMGVIWRRVFEYSGGSWQVQGDIAVPNVFTYFVSAACMHCEKPACVDVCPAGSMTKRADGIVLINQDQCIGCRYCQWACPYGAPQFDEAKGVMSKCTFCEDLLAKGERPACVDGCPFRALDFGPLDELQAKNGTLSDPAPLPDPALTKPAVVYIPHRQTQQSRNGTGHIMNVELAVGG